MAGTSWDLINHRPPDGTITNIWKTDVTISFSADRTVSGSAGRSSYEVSRGVSGSWDEPESGVPDSNGGQELIFDALSRTEMAWEDEAVKEQEAEFLDLLQDGRRWVLIRREFNLRDAEGDYLFDAEPA